MIGALKWLYLLLTELLYTRLAPCYDLAAWLVSLGQWGRWRECALPYVAGERALELGFGTGHLAAQMSLSGRTVTGIDASPQMVMRSAKRFRANGDPVMLVQGKAQELPFGCNCFDTIVSTFPAQYILDASTVHECERVLVKELDSMKCDKEKGGLLVIAGLWVETDWAWLRMLTLGFYGPSDPRALGEFGAQLQDAGLSPAFTESRVGRTRFGIVVASRES